MNMIDNPAKKDILDQILANVQQHLPPDQSEPVSVFARYFFNTASYEDLQQHNVNDLYGALLSLWGLMKRHETGLTSIKLYNPNFEQHGWQSTHTILEIVTDDMPFLVDSTRMELDRLGLTIHTIIHTGGVGIQRDNSNKILQVNPRPNENAEANHTLAVLYFEIDRQTDQAVLRVMEENLERVLGDVRLTVEDWMAMRNKVNASIEELQKTSANLDPSELAESLDFLRWIEDHHFTFMGSRDYDLATENGTMVLRLVPESGLGVLRDTSTSLASQRLTSMTPEAQELALSSQILIISETSTHSTVHRNVNTAYIGIKKFDKNGKVIGERRFIGLFTASAYNTNPRHIPFLRRKVALVMEMSGLNPRSHAGKVVLNIVETLPRDDLFQATAEELLNMSMGIFHIQERRMIRLFIRRDIFGRFYSCLVYLPRDRFNTELREAMQAILADALNATEISYTTRITDSVLARIHYVARVNPEERVEYDIKELEQKLGEISRTWPDEMAQSLLDYYGEEQGNALAQKYRNSFQSSYRESYLPLVAVYDIKHIEKLSDENPLELNFYRPMEDLNGALRLKVYRLKETIPLSDVLPILSNMGLRVISEKPHQIIFRDGTCAWINDFGMNYTGERLFDVDSVKDIFQEAFSNIWFNRLESDGFNSLVLCGRLNSHEITILRAYAKYLQQVGFTFTQAYIEATLANNPGITTSLIELFKIRFDPKQAENNELIYKGVIEGIEKDLEVVANLDEDRILRRYLDLINATLRTNYFQRDENQNPKSYLAFKFDPSLIPGMPLPKPKFEIFVYSPRFEGVHLRGGKVARGGLRWSDRREDFRTEVLGLMKAQQVKNSVIVPAGAKGGFFPKNMPVDASRDEILKEGIACYQDFIRALLDITDNYLNGVVIPPKNVVRYDEDDTYLVVAADKGTATFSDYANAISKEYNFWLDDAFASGGSAGYDHKKMAITAKGAWESVKRHFREIGHDINRSPFTTVGIGDMAGDVFGNGVLLSKQMKLIAVFNHMHIFLDPDPDLEKSFAERQRMFNLPRSTWEDYNPKLISKGGGVFSRKAKSIKLSPEIQAVLDFHQETATPNEVILAMLKAPVDLLWNGGIGTFVKSTQETNLNVGDRTNDNIRINGSQLRCKIVGEGGNLGFTQLGRTEYAIAGGRIYTDFIDNSAGVDCSDHEVNIKILLNQVVVNGDMTLKQRNELLVKMTDEVAALVLQDNYHQTQAIGLAQAQAARNIELHGRYIAELERKGLLDRALEFLPDEKTIIERRLSGLGLVAPGIAVLLSYSKNILKQEILDSDVPEDPALNLYLEREFPHPLVKKYPKQMLQHGLKREIIATQLSNSIINKMGFTFIYRLLDETGAPPSAIVRAYVAASRIFGLDELWQNIQSLDDKISAQDQNEMMIVLIRLIRRATRWFLRNRRSNFDILDTVTRFKPGVTQLKEIISDHLLSEELHRYEEKLEQISGFALPPTLVKEIATSSTLQSALDIIDAVVNHQLDLSLFTSIYFKVGDLLELSWIRRQVIEHTMENHWDALSREAIRDDLDWQQKQLAVSVLKLNPDIKSVDEAITLWSETYAGLIQRWQLLLVELRAVPSLSYTMLYVSVRELLDLTQTCAAGYEAAPLRSIDMAASVSKPDQTVQA